MTFTQAVLKGAVRASIGTYRPEPSTRHLPSTTCLPGLTERHVNELAGFPNRGHKFDSCRRHRVSLITDATAGPRLSRGSRLSEGLVASIGTSSRHSNMNIAAAPCQVEPPIGTFLI
jgi:hypothetical protein